MAEQGESEKQEGGFSVAATGNGAAHSVLESIPQHVAIIMDGNGRWAKERGLPRLAGHGHGVEAVRRVLEYGVKAGVRYITLYAFSSENWLRSEQEVDGLMALFAKYLYSEQATFMREGIRLMAIGDRSRLPHDVVMQLEECEKLTAKNEKLTLILAVSYGARDELVRATKKIASQIKANQLQIEQITEDLISDNLDTAQIPDPDLLIRTSGESRISNFLLWQLAYTEIIVTQVLWPDFSGKEFEQCIIEYSKRSRRFGRTDSVDNLSSSPLTVESQIVGGV